MPIILNETFGPTPQTKVNFDSFPYPGINDSVELYNGGTIELFTPGWIKTGTFATTGTSNNVLLCRNVASNVNLPAGKYAVGFRQSSSQNNLKFHYNIYLTTGIYNLNFRSLARIYVVDQYQSLSVRIYNANYTALQYQTLNSSDPTFYGTQGTKHPELNNGAYWNTNESYKSYDFNVSSDGSYILEFSAVSGTSIAAGSTATIFIKDVVIETKYPCFLEGSRILRMNVDTYEEEYVPIETLREGDLIKTSCSGYKAIQHIGSKTIPNPTDDPNKKNRLYRFPKYISRQMIADLHITGEHCVLYKDLSDTLKERVYDHMGDIYITEESYRVPACLDERALPYKGEGPVTIWHFALENSDITHNYGVYANGLLVESCSIKYLSELSKMKLVTSVPANTK